MKDLTHQDFSRVIDQLFTLKTAGVEMELKLIEVQPYRGEVPDYVARHPFSLQFAGPAGNVMPQATYRLEHPGMGALDVFLVPIGANRDRVLYEAIFS